MDVLCKVMEFSPGQAMSSKVNERSYQVKVESLWDPTWGQEVGYVADGKQCPARSTDVPYKKQIFLGSSTLVRLMQGQDIQKGTEGMPLKVRRAQRGQEIPERTQGMPCKVRRSQRELKGCHVRSGDPRDNSRDAAQAQEIPERTKGMPPKVRRSQRELKGCRTRSGDPRENLRDAAQGQEIRERTQGMLRKVRRS